MIDLFSELPGIDRGIIRVPQFSFVKENLVQNIDRVVDYYHKQPLNVRNEHILVRLITSLNVSFRRDFENYLDVTSDNAMHVARVMGFTSSTFFGRVFTKGYFYGDGVPEILIMDDSIPADLTEDSDWRTLQAVRVLRHPFTDFSLDLPDGTYNGSNEGGLAVIVINAPLLMAMYRGWERDEHYNAQGVPVRTVHQFVRMFVLTNMIYSHVDIALFNRINALYRGEPVAPFRTVHPISVFDQHSRMDDVLEDYLNLVRRRHETFDQLLLHMPVLCNNTMLEAMILPKVLQLRQVKWALILARLPLIRFLVKLNRDTNNPLNTAPINRIRYAVREIKNDRTIEGLISRDIHAEYKRGIAEDIVPGTAYWEP